MTEIEEEIRSRMFERFDAADEIEIVQCVTSTEKEDIYFVRIIFESGYDINYIVLTYADEFLDFFRFEFSLPTMVQEAREELK
jgi:hypothetical protein